MEAAAPLTKTLTSLNLNRQISSTLLFQKYPRLRPHHISPTLLRTRSLSPTASNGAVFPLSSKLISFLSLSSSSTTPSVPPPSNNAATQPSDGGVFRWYRSSDPSSIAGASPPAVGKAEVAAVVLGWLGAEQKHLRRYAEMYRSKGMDAVTFVVPVMELMRCDLGRKVEVRIEKLADELVSWLSNDGGDGGERRLVFHTFSTTGWLVYGSILALWQGRPDLIERIKGCIFDSNGDPQLDPKVWAAGFTAALVKKRNTRIAPSTKSKEPGTDENKHKVQDDDPLMTETAVLFLLEKVFTFLFKLPDVTQKLMKLINLLSEDQPPCPQLYLYSTADKVIRYKTVESFIEHQKMKGRDVRSFNFGSSPHVDHYRTFPDVYTSLVNSFLSECLVMGK